MESVIYNPLEEYESKYKNLHLENTNKFFENLVKKSGVDIEKNRATVKLYNEYKENLSKLRRSFNWWRFLRVIMCITIILIPLVISKLSFSTIIPAPFYNFLFSINIISYFFIKIKKVLFTGLFILYLFLYFEKASQAIHPSAREINNIDTL